MPIIYQNVTIGGSGIPGAPNMTITISGGSVTAVGASGPNIVSDYDVYVSQTVSSYQVQNPWQITCSISGATFSSSATYVATVDSSGVVTPVSNGTTTISVIAGGLTKNVNLTVTQSSPTITNTFSSVKSGSLPAHLTSQISSRISGVTASSSTYGLFGVGTTLGSVYVRNTSLWCHDVDLTFWSPWNSDAGNQKAGSLVTPRHVAFAHHYPVGTGATLHFVDNSNNLITRTIAGISTTYSPDSGNDLCIVTLSSDLPSSITPITILPNTDASATSIDAIPYATGNYPGNVGTGQMVSVVYSRPAVVMTNQDQNLFIAQLYNQGGSDFTDFDYPNNTTMQAFYPYGIRVGDSGHPQFCIVNGVASFLGCVYANTGGSLNGAIFNPWGTYFDYINNVLIPYSDAQAGISNYANGSSWDTSGGRYILRKTNLSTFPVYSTP